MERHAVGRKVAGKWRELRVGGWPATAVVATPMPTPAAAITAVASAVATSAVKRWLGRMRVALGLIRGAVVGAVAAVSRGTTGTAGASTAG